MTLERLDNLVKTGEVHEEAADQGEFERLVSMARRRLADSQVSGLSEEGQFLAAYSSAHSLAIAAMRWHGYRTTKRYLVFLCLEHTVGMDKAKWRLLDKCHKQRNLAEYEGEMEVDPQLLKELVQITNELLEFVETLGPVN